MNFEKWMNKVDDYLISKVGMSSEDLPDYHWMDDYEDELSPKESALNYLAEEDLI